MEVQAVGPIPRQLDHLDAVKALTQGQGCSTSTSVQKQPVASDSTGCDCADLTHSASMLKMLSHV